GRLMTAVYPYLSYDMWLAARTLPHLHNDAIDFAVGAGLPGLLVYLAILLTPIAAAWGSPRDAAYELRLLGCGIISIAYFFDGLTDLMFGRDFHGMLYVCLVAVLLGYCADRTTAAA